MKKAGMTVLLLLGLLAGGLYTVFYGQWVVGEVIEHAMEMFDE